jgi:hypothetical protein
LISIKLPVVAGGYDPQRPPGDRILRREFKDRHDGSG